MKVILLVDVKGVGREGDLMNVKDGFAIHTLIPQQKAVEAVGQHLHTYQQKQIKTQQDKEKNSHALKKFLDTNSTLRFVGKANDKGKLFANVTKKQIQEKIVDISLLPKKSFTVIMSNPITSLGQHTIHIKTTQGEYAIIIEVCKPSENYNS